MNRHNTQFVFVGALVVLLAACSGGHAPSAPTPDEAQAAIQAALDQDALAQRDTAPNVTNVSIGACRADGDHPVTVCATHWSANGVVLDNQVAFWTTPNPRHPWRAHIIHSTR